MNSFIRQVLSSPGKYSPFFREVLSQLGPNVAISSILISVNTPASRTYVLALRDCRIARRILGRFFLNSDSTIPLGSLSWIRLLNSVILEACWTLLAFVWRDNDR